MRFFKLVVMSALLLLGYQTQNAYIQTLYYSLDPCSIIDHMTFYQLHPTHPLGLKAIDRAKALIGKHRKQAHEQTLFKHIHIKPLDIQSLSRLSAFATTSTTMTSDQVEAIDKLASNLGNRKLKGYQCKKKCEILGLKTEEVDLARALLLHQFNENMDEIRSYESTLDMMAIEILGHLPKNPSHEQMIHAINRLIFYKLQFRFPPHSLWAKDVDEYTFLPSVLDSRQGVCLGVSIIYLSLAQRLNLPLSIVTPKGHIYLSYEKPSGEINIETTARGMHVDTKHYYGINTRYLRKRSIKEVIGLAFFNQAAVSVEKKDHKAAVEQYEKALQFIENDGLVHHFLGIQYFLMDNNDKARKHLMISKKLGAQDEIIASTLADSILKNRHTKESLYALMQSVDETRTSILDKQEKLYKALSSAHPQKELLMALAITHLQLSRTKEAYQYLSKYHHIDPSNPIVEYYLALLSSRLMKYDEAWAHLDNATDLVKKFHYSLDLLIPIRYELMINYPKSRTS